MNILRKNQIFFILLKLYIICYGFYKKRVLKNLDTILNYGVSPIASAIPCLYLKN